MAQAVTPPASLRAWLSSSPVRDVVLSLLVAGGYWLLAEAALFAQAPAGSVTPFWPSAGLAVAAVFLGGSRLLPAVLIGATLTMLSRVPPAVAFAVGAGAALEALAASYLLKRFAFDPRMERVRDPLLLIAVVAPLAAVVEALVGTTSTFLAGQFGGGELFASAVLWWARHWLGIVLGAALVFAWTRGRGVPWTPARAAEAVALLGAIGLVILSVFGLAMATDGQNRPVAFVLFPVIGWAGLRFGARGAATVTALVAAIALPYAASGGGPFRQFDLESTQFLLHAFLMLSALSGLVLGAIMAERDDAHARRLALEEQLRHSQKMEAVGRLAGGIAHDFNNLLTAIIGYTEIVLLGLDPKDPRRADAEEIGRAAMRAADLTRQMLAFSRRQILQPKVIDLNTALSKVEPMLRRVIGEDIVMTIAPRATHALTRVDPGQVEQVIMNLVVNARDAMPQGGRLTVETGDALLDEEAVRENPDARPGPYVMLAVSDTGVGMPAEVRARIFEPYFTTKEVGKGTGLGLSTVYGIIRQSDGHISVYSEPGLGTTFRVYLPRAEAAAVAATDDATRQMPTGTEHVLLVEDESSVRRLSREILTRLGYSVTEAASGRAGLALGTDDTRHFDVALCDVILGDMSGPAVVEALRALRPSIRVLYMSGYTDDAIVSTGVLESGQPFLQKPFTPAQLAHKIREVLDAAEE
ncbi:MAG: MASE1 domain-containing protein [Acidobacteriota bacterium]